MSKGLTPCATDSRSWLPIALSWSPGDLFEKYLPEKFRHGVKNIMRNAPEDPLGQPARLYGLEV
jgi:hypothetical protein